MLAHVKVLADKTKKKIYLIYMMCLIEFLLQKVERLPNSIKIVKYFKFSPNMVTLDTPNYSFDSFIYLLQHIRDLEPVNAYLLREGKYHYTADFRFSDIDA